MKISAAKRHRHSVKITSSGKFFLKGFQLLGSVSCCLTHDLPLTPAVWLLAPHLAAEFIDSLQILVNPQDSLRQVHQSSPDHKHTSSAYLISVSVNIEQVFPLSSSFVSSLHRTLSEKLWSFHMVNCGIPSWSSPSSLFNQKHWPNLEIEIHLYWRSFWVFCFSFVP